MTVVTRRMDDEGEVDEDSGSLWADQASASHWPTRQGGEGGGGVPVCYFIYSSLHPGLLLYLLYLLTGGDTLYSIFLLGVLLYTLLLHCYYRGCQALLHLTVLLN